MYCALIVRVFLMGTMAKEDFISLFPLIAPERRSRASQLTRTVLVLLVLLMFNFGGWYLRNIELALKVENLFQYILHDEKLKKIIHRFH